jgi:hypothetical protein
MLIFICFVHAARHLNSDRTLQQIMFQQKQKINYIGILHIDDGKK